MPLRASAADSSPPLSPPPYIGSFTCSQGTPAVLEPYRFSPDSKDWYGGLEELEDPAPTDEEYVRSETVEGQLGVEFPLPLNYSTAIGDSEILISAKYVSATTAILNVIFQYFDLSDNLWHDLTISSAPPPPITLTATYAFTPIADVLSSLPSSLSITKLRVLVVVDTLDAGEVRVNHLTIPYCSLAATLLSPPPPSPLLPLPPSPPDTPGTLPPFIEIEEPLPPLPPPPPTVLSPLPPGSEILRPNRDILVRLWQPRPAFMQLNDPLNLDNPVDVAVPLYGPATVETFDEITGNYTGTIRPRVEVGFTTPVTEGPWEALQLRFRAARSRPPQPEPVVPPLPVPGTKEPATYPCPDEQTLFWRGTDFSGVWQIPPLEYEIADSIDHPNNNCFISAPVEVPPGAPGQIALMPNQLQWDAGYNQIKVRLVSRGRAAKLTTTDSYISGIQANTFTFTPAHAQLPAGAPNYQVTWNPFGCNSQLQAYGVSPTEIVGTGLLQTNMDIHAEFFLAAQDSDNLAIQVSSDGIHYQGAVVFDLVAFQSTVIYFRIALNKEGQPTPIRDIAVAAALIITGPYVVTGLDIIQYPQDTPPFIIGVSPSPTPSVPLTSQCRLGISLQGNMALMQSSVQYTDILTSDWLKYELTWKGFWSADSIKDLRVKLSPEALLLEDDSPFIDISAMDVVISPYCPGISQPISQPLIKLNQVDILPTADVSVTGWSPVPAWLMLFSDPTLASDNDVMADPRTDNQLLVEMADPAGFPDVDSGYMREWIAVEAIIQARIVTWSSANANLLVSTTFGQEQWTPPLANDQAVYYLTWNYDPGLTTDQINRLKVAVIAHSLDGAEVYDPVDVALCALTVRLTFRDVLITPSPPSLPPPPPTVDSIFTVVESDPEVFSCGSLGDCGAPAGRIVAKIKVTNPDTSPVTVNFIMSGRANIRVSDASDTFYPLSYTIPDQTPITFFIYGWIGNQTDPFPVEPADGEIIISLIYSDGVNQIVHQIDVPWYYIGL
jgi:hypothetical protein